MKQICPKVPLEKMVSSVVICYNNTASTTQHFDTNDIPYDQMI